MSTLDSDRQDFSFSEADIEHMLANLDSFSPEEIAEILARLPGEWKDVTDDPFCRVFL